MKIHIGKNGIKYVETDDSSFHKTKESMNKPTVISLFSGAGGLDIGLEQAGFQTLVCVENDINCRETLRFNSPEWKLFESTEKKEKGHFRKRLSGDIRDIDAKELLKFSGHKKGEITLVAGGAPCQPFSNIGKREGRNDKSNGDLFLEFVRMVKGIHPTAFLFENVAGIVQKKHGDVIQYMADQFKVLGYSISYSILNAANYGVAQRRERFFLIGIKGVNSPAFPLPTHFKDKRSWDKFISEVDIHPQYTPKRWIPLKTILGKIPSNAIKRPDYALMNISDMVIERMKHIRQGENFKVLPLELRPNCWKNGKHQGQDTFGRLSENAPSITIRTAAYNPAKGMYIHPTQNRGLSTIELAAIQGFPYHWQFKCFGREKITLVSGGKQIGNAVPPPLAKALGIVLFRQIMRHD